MSRARFLNNHKFTKIEQELESYLKIELELVRCKAFRATCIGWGSKDGRRRWRMKWRGEGSEVGAEMVRRIWELFWFLSHKVEGWLIGGGWRSSWLIWRHKGRVSGWILATQLRVISVKFYWFSFDSIKYRISFKSAEY